jgi:hypothetical protein
MSLDKLKNHLQRGRNITHKFLAEGKYHELQIAQVVYDESTDEKVYCRFVNDLKFRYISMDSIVFYS